MSKYGANKTVIDGVIFDSKKEAKRYNELKAFEKAGIIQDIRIHEKYILVESFRDDTGKIERAITYSPDFVYYDLINKITVAEDVKSTATARDQVYIIKRKLFKKKYPGIKFKEVI